ncbi:hypothetical protein PGB90_006027 [Kerria lacca]
MQNSKCRFFFMMKNISLKKKMSNKLSVRRGKGVHFFAQFISGLHANQRVYERTGGTHLESMSCTNYSNRHFQYLFIQSPGNLCFHFAPETSDYLANGAS